ncbi:membrane protein [Rhodococcus phage GuyFagieri]|nr:membrane protein [Rhodococcus phage GuyFagieri]
MDPELIKALAMLLAGVATATATIIVAVKKVAEGNYVTVRRRLAAVELNQRRQNVIIGHLSNWQVIARQLMRQQTAKIISLGGEIDPEMLRLQAFLDRELTIEEIMADDDQKED